MGLAIAWTVAFEFALMCELQFTSNGNLDVLTGTVSCWPIAFEWNPDLNGTCVNQIPLFQAALATDVITDGGTMPTGPFSNDD